MTWTGPRTYLAVGFGVFAFGAPAFGAGQLIEDQSVPLGRFSGLEYVLHTGRFVGSTSTGEYRVPYEIAVPANAALGNGIVVVEPPHFAFRTAARDVLLGREFLLGQGFTHAAVGWSFFGQSILETGASDVFIDGGAGGQDAEIISDFARAMRAGAPALPPLGDVTRVYGFGYSQTSTAVLTVLYTSEAPGLFDFTLVVGVPAVGLAAVLPTPFAPPVGGGPILAGLTEADLVLFGSAVLRGDDGLFPGYRSYEIAGMGHLPSGTGFGGAAEQDWRPVARALFAAGHAWVTRLVPPPPSVAIESAAPGEIDPIYGGPTGIQRDAVGNAVGGVRVPDLALGRARFVAADFSNPFPIPGFVGGFVDLSCSAEFLQALPHHGHYVAAYEASLRSLIDGGLVLDADAAVMRRRAAHSEVGQPGACPVP